MTQKSDCCGAEALGGFKLLVSGDARYICKECARPCTLQPAEPRCWRIDEYGEYRPATEEESRFCEEYVKDSSKGKPAEPREDRITFESGATVDLCDEGPGEYRGMTQDHPGRWMLSPEFDAELNFMGLVFEREGPGSEHYQRLKEARDYILHLEARAERAEKERDELAYQVRTLKEIQADDNAKFEEMRMQLEDYRKTIAQMGWRK